MGGSEQGAHNESGEKGTSDRLQLWILLEGDRLVLAAVLLVAISGVLLVLYAVGLFRVAPSSPTFLLFSSLVGGNLTLITVVLSINQLVLSRELGDPGNLSSRVEGAISYRREVEKAAGVVTSPVQPGAFLQFLYESLGEQVQVFEDARSARDEPDFRERTQKLVASIRRDVERVDETLGDGVQIFTVLSATIATTHAEQIQWAVDLRERFGDELGDEGHEALERLLDQLYQIDVARKYFETVYVQRELAYLSRLLLYVGLPAVILAAAVLLSFGTVTATSTSARTISVLVPVAVVVGFAPISVLFSFVLRLSWVAQQIATVAPFTTGTEG